MLFASEETNKDIPGILGDGKSGYRTSPATPPQTLFQREPHVDPISLLGWMTFKATARFSASRLGSGWYVVRSRPLNGRPFSFPQLGDQIIPVPTGADDSFSTASLMSSVVLFDADQSDSARRSDFAATPSATSEPHCVTAARQSAL